MESTWLTKEIYKKALEEGRVYMSANNHTRSGITQYNLYILNPTPDITGMVQVCGHSNYWSDAKQVYWVCAWGTSRPLEVILSVGYKLGLKFEEIRQKWIFI